MNFLIILLIINYLTFVECFIMTFNQKSKNIVKNKKCLKNRKFSNENEKYLYANYLVSLRKIKRAQKSINYNNIFSINNFSYVDTNNDNNNNNNNNINYLNLTTYNELFLNINNNDKIAKNLILANIKIDVSNVKYIQISTKNDTMIIELDKNENNKTTETTDNKGFINYDLGKIDALISAISILMNLLNIH
jgi:hypothetical protein